MPLSLTNLSMRFLLGKLFLTWALGEAGGSVSACAGDSAVGLWQSLKLGAVNCDFFIQCMQFSRVFSIGLCLNRDIRKIFSL